MTQVRCSLLRDMNENNDVAVGRIDDKVLPVLAVDASKTKQKLTNR